MFFKLTLFCGGYDINGDGQVTVKEFKRIMARTG